MILLAALALLPMLACEHDLTRRLPGGITIVSPGSGDVLSTGTDVDIQWQILAEIVTIDIDISRDGGLTWNPLATDVDVAAVPYSWTVAGPVSGNCRLRISDAGDETKSAQTGSFEIATAFLTVVSPNGNEKWGIASTRNIRWSGLGLANVKIELSRNGGATWEPTPIADPLDVADGSYAWKITSPASATCKVRVSDADGGPLSDMSNGLFEIAMPTLLLLTPVGGSWQIQDTMDITWVAIGVDDIRIDISRDGGAWTPLTGDMPAYTGLFSWSVSPGGVSLPQLNCRVRVVNVANETLAPESPIFTILWDDVYRVKWNAPVGGDGKTWQAAFRHPQVAVTVAGSANEIWVAAGTYTDTDFDSVVLALDINTTIYGGFLGDEYAFPAQRTGVSKLDGLNSARGVTGASNAMLDGFTVVRGNTSGNGGGMLNLSSNVVVANCVFGGSVSTGNTATGNGGGIYNSSSMTITDCIFSSNTALRGGGLYSFGATTIVDCIFDGNTATTTISNNGGGGVAGAGGTLSVTGCQFTSNTAYCGGGAAGTGGVVTFDKCVFTANVSTATITYIGGGGLSCVTGGTVSNCVFWRNSARYGGGIFTNVWALATLLIIVNCSIAENSATYGGGIYDYFSEQYLPIVNTIVWGNTNSGIDVASPFIYPPWVSYSCLQNNIVGTVGTGNIFVDPKFSNMGGGNFHLSSSSPCINTGTSVGAPADDLDGTSRPRGAGYDMGAYEY